jgi:hypothetical protein
MQPSPNPQGIPTPQVSLQSCPLGKRNILNFTKCDKILDCIAMSKP